MIPPFTTHKPLISSSFHSCRTIAKQWGTEYIITNHTYCMKAMKVLPGAQCSLHFHREKEETFLLVRGNLTVTYYKPNGLKVTLELKPSDSVSIPRCMPHTFSVPKDQEEPSIFIEASTPDDPSDSYRLNKSQGPQMT